MYSYEDRCRAVQLYIKLGRRVGLTIRQLGYPTKNALKSWYREYEQRLDLPAGYVRRPRYSQAHKERAVGYLPGARPLHRGHDQGAGASAVEIVRKHAVLICSWSLVWPYHGQREANARGSTGCRHSRCRCRAHLDTPRRVSADPSSLG